MSERRYSFGGISIPAWPGWVDVTEVNEPFTLSKGKLGVGALQFSIVLYRRGPLPNATIETLKEMLEEFRNNRCLGEPFDEDAQSGNPVVASASFQNGGDFVRVWYVSDGQSFALVTYVSAWGEQGPEVVEAEQIVRSLRFESAGAA